MKRSKIYILGKGWICGDAPYESEFICLLDNKGDRVGIKTGQKGLNIKRIILYAKET